MRKASLRLAAWPLSAGGILLLLLGGCSVPTRHPPASPIRVPLVEKVPNGKSGERTHVEKPADEPLRSGATLDEFRLYAAAHNPGLRALYQKWRAQVERAPQARALPERRSTPRVSVTNPSSSFLSLLYRSPSTCGGRSSTPRNCPRAATHTRCTTT